MRPKSLAWLSGLVAMWLAGCHHPCENTAQCGEEGMCAASVCQALSCEMTIFAIDPKSGDCVPLSGCFLSPEQRLWRTCSDDPCRGRDENTCIDDARCQPVYANPDLNLSSTGGLGGSSRPAQAACGVAGDDIIPPLGGLVNAPGVNNGESRKHARSSGSGCTLPDNRARAYSGCRAAPKIEAVRPCEQLDAAACRSRRDCTSEPTPGLGGIAVDLPASPPRSADGSQRDQAFTGQCFSRFSAPAADCSFADAQSCLLSPACQPIGSRCYCPPGAECACEGGTFLGCEPNDRLRRCHFSSDCRPDERCDNDESCIEPRTFVNSGSVATEPVPGTGSCVGACVPRGCSGMGEQMCNEHSECDGGSYGTRCRPKPYCAGGGVTFDPTVTESADAAGPVGGNCGCDSEFVGCAPQPAQAGLRSERSLLIRDPEIIDAPGFRLDAVLEKLAPPGRADEFVAGFLEQVGASQALANGALVRSRGGFAYFLSELSPDVPGVAQRLAGYLHTTALVNRLDLAHLGDCGEARLTYALTRAYTDGNQRMTLIIELHVPDDGSGCRSVAQRWAELSLLDDIGERRTRLLSLYGELLKPANLGQIRTNEFLNRTGKEPWELREFHLNGSGMLELVPVAQTVDARFAATSGFLAWAKQNASEIKLGNAVIPSQYLAGASREDGGRLSLMSGGDAVKELEKSLNAQSCAGCHLTETKSPFVHIGERLGRRSGAGYVPKGRAVIDEFLQKELVQRAENLQRVLAAVPLHSLRSAGPLLGLARVH